MLVHRIFVSKIFIHTIFNSHTKTKIHKSYKNFATEILLILTQGFYYRNYECTLTQHIDFQFGHDSSFYRSYNNIQYIIAAAAIAAEQQRL